MKGSASDSGALFGYGFEFDDSFTFFFFFGRSSMGLADLAYAASVGTIVYLIAFLLSLVMPMPL